jgi:arylsulfatase
MLEKKGNFGLKAHLFHGSTFWLVSSIYITILTVINFRLNIYFRSLDAADRLFAVRMAVWYNFSFFLIIAVVWTLALSLILSNLKFLKGKFYRLYLLGFLFVCFILQSSQLLGFQILGKPTNPRFIAMMILLLGIAFLFLFLLSKLILRSFASLGLISLVAFLGGSLIISVLGSSSGLEALDQRYDRPNILIISIDTLRKDHCSFNGYWRQTTPNLDRLAKESVVFSNAFSCSPLTLPSLGSIMTGNYPQKHGVRDNFNYRLGPENLTLAEILKEEGYSTGAVVANRVIHSSRKLDQGFDYYGESFAYDHLSYLIPGLISYKVLVERAGLEHLWYWKWGAGYCTDLSLRWLREHYRKRFFLWVHYMDPHCPYDPPKKFADNFKLPSETWFEGKFTYDSFNQIYENLPPKEEEIQGIHRLYDGEILYADHEIGRFLETVKRLGLLQNTIVIFTSDHGEGLGDEHYWYGGHGHFIFSEDLNVPLFIRFPDERFQGLVTTTLSNIDIFAAVLDLLGILDKYAQRIDAVSFPPLRQQTKERNSPAILAESGERLAFDPRRIEAIKEGGENPYKLIPEEKRSLTAEVGLEVLNEKKLRAVIDGDWKLIYTPAHEEAEHFELYNLRQDPDELVDLSGEEPGQFSRLQGSLLSWISADTLAAPTQTLEVSKQEIEALKALGYFR